MSEEDDPYSFMKEAFANASRDARTDRLFEAGTDFINALLGRAKQAGAISRYFQQRGKEHPVLPHATFYIVGVDAEWRYQNAKRGGPRVQQEKSLVDYYMHAKIMQDQTMEMSFTTSQHAHAAKKMGWKRGVHVLNVRDEASLLSSDAENFVNTIASFLAEHAVTLAQQGERRRRTMQADGPGIRP